MDIREKLKEIDGLMSGTAYIQKWNREREQRETAQYEIDRLVDGKIVENDSGRHFVAISGQDICHVHGSRPLGDALTVSPADLAVAGNDGDLAAMDLSQSAFIDTETTGLAGGTGTYAFMIGVGRFTTDDVFEVRQFFMRDFDEEESMLVSLAEYLDDVSSLVTYNGKSFDVPLLKTRFISTRLRFDLDELPHFDLLHAARRLWKRRLDDCSLNNIERHVLGVARHGDVPGSLIPRLYFDYLRSRDARPLVPAFRHNRVDVLSMVSLAAAVCEAVNMTGDMCTHVDDRLSLARLYFRQAEMHRVIELAEQILCDKTDDRSAEREALYLSGFAMKKLGMWDKSSRIWSRLVETFPDDVVPWIELAKFYEHRSRELEKAAWVCEQALERMDGSATHVGDEPDKTVVRELTRRLTRIRRKMNRL
ncbi:MAG: ribonuclease H-like domain-containing protein [Candidatus Hydrogenedentes bacterium]|nr:ribonuclease H-like domain-containing protein [Candidatus Hydrogenedentota bacterium]